MQRIPGSRAVCCLRHRAALLWGAEVTAKIGSEVSPSRGVTRGSPKLSQQQFASPYCPGTAPRDQLAHSRDAMPRRGSLSPSFPVSPALQSKGHLLFLFIFFFGPQYLSQNYASLMHVNERGPITREGERV